jgi:hypothetical protein
MKIAIAEEKPEADQNKQHNKKYRHNFVEWGAIPFFEEISMSHVQGSDNGAGFGVEGAGQNIARLRGNGD